MMKEKLTFTQTFDLALDNQKKKNYKISIDFYNRLLKIDPNNKAILNNLGLSFYGLAMYQEAKDFFTRATYTDPNYIGSYYNLGLTLKKLGDFKESINYFEKTIKLNPKHIDALNNIGLLHHKNGNFNKAIKSYEKAIKINPDYLHSYNNLGTLFQDLNESFKAISCYKKIIKINPNYLTAHYNLGVIYTKLGDDLNAITHYKRSLEIDSNLVLALNNLGLCFKRLGESHKALDCFEKAINISPNYVNSYNNLGILSFENKDYKKSKKYYLKAIEIDPNYADAHINLGLMFKEIREPLKAISCYQMAISIIPNFANYHNELGVAFYELDQNSEAINSFKKALKIDPNHIRALYNLSEMFKLLPLHNLKKNYLINLKDTILFLFKRNDTYLLDIFHNAKLILLSEVDNDNLQKLVHSDSLLLGNLIIQDLLKEELFHLMLQKSLLSDIFFEKLIIRIRSELLLTLNSNRDHLDFIISLAEQCWLNEFIYAQSDKEINFVKQLKDKIENDKEINELEIAILGCYTPLNSSKIISNKLLNYKSENVLFNDLIDVQINEPLKEIELKKLIKSLDQIEDSVSKKVREQYEENPYPRWRYTYTSLPLNSSKIINSDIDQNIITVENYFDEPNVLIAGCGTGNHTISAMRYKNASITSIDLSLASLAYAKRKTDELGFNNIEYLHADILQLKKLNKKFDIIESSGVLHHMKDPVAGLKILVDILEPHGFLKIGLYSEIARQHIVSIRKFIKENNFKNTVDDIKTCRQLLINDQEEPLLKRITIGKEFYSTSSIRDLLFHVQEHRFTLPEISKMLKDLNLEFLGFIHPSNSTTKKYSKYFPDDKKNTSLDNWHEFEKRNPDTFLSMYQFWVRKN